ncbi:MAG: protein TolR [Granulosicoccaceae bacterium]
MAGDLDLRRSDRKRRQVAEMNVVPYIDVMLVLLVIFMITAPLLKTGVDVELPKSEAEPLDTRQDEPLILTVTASGQLYLSVGESPDEPLARDAAFQLAAAVIRQQPNKRVLVAGDEGVAYGDVVNAMTILQAAGAQQIGLMTEPPG